MAKFGDNDGLNQSVAESIVFDNFSGDDLGLGDQGQGDDDLGDQGDDDDAGLDASSQDELGPDDEDDLSALIGDEVDDDGNVIDFQQRQPNDMRRRVTHTDGQQPKPRPLARNAEVKPDKNGNLVDKNGAIVARAGAQARFYQNWQKEKRKAGEATAQIQDTQSKLMRAVQIGREMNDELMQHRASAKALKDMGFAPQDQINAMQLYSDLRTSPQETVRKLLTRMAAQGINVTGTPQNGGFDPKSFLELVRNEIGKATNPLRERSAAEQADRQRQTEQRQQYDSVQNEVKTFFSRNPEAQRHVSVFQRVMADPRYASWPIEAVWAAIRPKLQNRRDPSSSRNRTPQAGSLPRGRGTVPTQQGREQNRDSLAPINDSWDKIIGGVMDDAGLKRAV